MADDEERERLILSQTSNDEFWNERELSSSTNVSYGALLCVSTTEDPPPPPPRPAPPPPPAPTANLRTRASQELRLSCSAQDDLFDVRRSHLALETDDPALGKTFSVETLRNGEHKRGMGIPSELHGAPETAEVRAADRHTRSGCGSAPHLRLAVPCGCVHCPRGRTAR